MNTAETDTDGKEQHVKAGSILVLYHYANKSIHTEGRAERGQMENGNKV